MASFGADRTRPSSPMSTRRTTFILCGVGVFLYWCTLYLYMPTLPTYVRSKSGNLALVGTVLSMYGLWQALTRLPLGLFSDRIGRRKPFIVAGLALAGLGAWVMGTSDTVSGLLVGRMITGLGAAAWVPLLVFFTSLYPPEQALKASALLTFVGSAARTVSMAITGTLNSLGGYGLAFRLAAGAGVLAALVMWRVPEKRRPSSPTSWSGIGRLMHRRDILWPSLISAVCQYANWAATFGFFPILAKELGATDASIGLLLAFNAVLLTVFNLLSSRLTERVSATTLLVIAISLLAGGLALGASAQQLWVLWVAQALIGIAQGVDYPVLMGLSIRYVAETERTSAMGWHQSVYAVGMFGGNVLSGVIANYTGIRAMLTGTGLATLALGLLGTGVLARYQAQRQRSQIGIEQDAV